MIRSDQVSPAWREVVFSLKTFSAAMLAYFIALRFDLPNPFWAVMAVYIVAHPLSGVTTSKAVYRLCGTVIGGAATIAIVPNLVGSPELMTLGICLWIGICLFFGLLDRTPRSYMFKLSGYTAAITGFALTASPENSFTYAISRVEEIAIGIICSALINRLVFPRPAGDVSLAGIDVWLRDAARLTLDSLDGTTGDLETLKDRRKLAADVVEIGNFMTHLSYDTSQLKDLRDMMRLLQWRMTRLLPLLSAFHDQIEALRLSSGELPADISRLIDQTTAWIQQTGGTSEIEQIEIDAQALNKKISTVESARSGCAWNDLLAVNFCLRLRRLVELWGGCTALRADAAAGTFRRHLERVQPARVADKSRQHRDYGMVFLSIFATMLATVLAVAFWVLTAWPAGSGAAMLAAASCCLFASMDDPVPAMRNFVSLTLIAILIAAVYQFIVFPRVTSFGPLAAALGLALIPAGIWMASPTRASIGTILCINFPMALGLQTRLHLDFGTFINQNTAVFAGLAFAAVTMAVVRSMGAETSAQRLLHIEWRELARLAVPGRTTDGNTFIQQMFDRIALLVPRLAAISPDSAVAATDIFRDMRIGLNIIELQKQKTELSSAHHALADELLTHLSTGYRLKRNHLQFEGTKDLSPTLRLLDKTLLAVSSSAGFGAIQALVGLRNAVSGGKHRFPSFSEPEGVPL